MYRIDGRSTNNAIKRFNKKQPLSLNDLPNEILERIFYFCEGFTIKRLSAVNRKFYANVVKISKFKSVWKKCVNTEMGAAVSQQLTRHNSPLDDNSDLSDVDSYLDDWYYKLYVKWYRSLNVGKWPSTETPMNGFFNPVTCVKVSGDLVIMGHKDGCVSICDYLSQNIEIACRHIRMVTDIALVDLAGKDVYRIFESREGAISRHHHIISISKDQNIRVYPIQSASKMDKEARVAFRHSPNELSYVRVFGEYCAVYSTSMKISLWRMSLPNPGEVDTCRPLDFTFVAFIICRERLPGWFNFWDNKVQCLCPVTGTLYEIEVDNDSCSANLLKLPISHRKSNPHQRYISRAFMLRSNVIIVTTLSGVLFYSTDGESLHEFLIYKHLTSKIISTALWGGILALGLECGQLVIYRCPHVADLATLHLRKPAYTRTLSANNGRKEPIISLDVDDYGEGPVVVASTHNAVSILKWFPNSQ